MNGPVVFHHQFQPAVYEGCGNKVLIVVLGNGWERGYRENGSVRQQLKEMGLRSEVDSVLVVTGRPDQWAAQGYHCTMEVFEPRGRDLAHPDLAGSWSTMCGNGIRALARYWLDRLPEIKDWKTLSVQTRSGMRTVSYLKDGRFKVYMGVYSDYPVDLEPYVAFAKLNPRAGRCRGIELVKQLDLSWFGGGQIVEAGIGLTGDPDGGGTINGEPHLVFWLDQEIDLGIQELEKAARSLGERLVRSEVFPKEINVSVALRREKGVVMAATYERGVYYVTQACGTGATVIGCQSNDSQVTVKMPGGNLKVEIRGLRTFLIGPASAAKVGEV